MTFSQSVHSALIDNYANFKGTASRSEYWWFALFFALAIFVVSFVFGIVIAMAGFGQAAIGIVGGVLLLALIVPTLAVWVRRCHDVGRSTGEAVASSKSPGRCKRSPGSSLDWPLCTASTWPPRKGALGNTRNNPIFLKWYS